MSNRFIKKDELTVSAAVINTKVRDIEGNVNKIKEAVLKAQSEGVDLAVTPELSISGYPLEDAVNNPDVLMKSNEGLEHLIEFSRGIKTAFIVGLPVGEAKGKVFNTSVVIQDGRVIGLAEKTERPNYGVFDEVRNFARGQRNKVFVLNGVKIGLMICEDTWHKNVSADLKAQGAEFLISTNSSPYETGKYRLRDTEVVTKRVEETGLPMLYVNQVGGQDEVIFDGGAFFKPVPEEGSEACTIPLIGLFDEDQQAITVARNDAGKIVAMDDSVTYVGPYPTDQSSFADIDLHNDYATLVMAVRDYCNKIGMKRVCLGMSGGVDSALVAAIAVDALGADNVKLIAMPSKFTSDMSNNLAYEEAERLGAEIDTVPIQGIVNEFMVASSEMFEAELKRVALENLQARARGIILMRVSNNNSDMIVLSTGNKSENAVGYATLYGDMNGGYNPLKDVLKTRVFELCHWRNRDKPSFAYGPDGEVIPVGIIDRPPTAELSEGQADSDSLPSYDILDDLIVRYAEQDQALDDIASEMGQSIEFVRRWAQAIDVAQYKRDQSCPGPKIRPRDFARDRRYPIASTPIGSLHKLKL